MRIAGGPKCASDPYFVCALRYGSKSGRGLPSNPTPANCNPSPGAAAMQSPATDLPPRTEAGIVPTLQPTRSGDPQENTTASGRGRVSAALNARRRRWGSQGHSPPRTIGDPPGRVVWRSVSSRLGGTLTLGVGVLEERLEPSTHPGVYILRACEDVGPVGLGCGEFLHG